MTWKTRFALTLLMGALLTASALGQDTPAATAEATAEVPAATVEAVEATAEAPAATAEMAATVEARPTIEHIVTTPQAVPTLTEDETTTTIGALTLVHPRTWFALQSPDGRALVTNVDLFALPADAEMPAETVIAQIEVFSKSQLPEEMRSIEYASDILSMLPVPEGQPTPKISELDVNGIVLARGDFSQPGNENIIFVRLLDEDTFALAIVGSITDGDVVKNESIFHTALATLSIVEDAPFAEETLTRYADVPQSVSPEGFPQLGNPDAPVKVVEIGSFDCPHCREFHDLAMPVLLERIQKGEVVFTYVPVFGTGSYPRGQEAALAAMCAADQGKFWEYHDGLFDWQEFGSLAFLSTRLHNGAEALGLDVEAFDACIDTNATLPVIDASVAYVQAMPAFNGTPTVLVNGMEIDWSRLPTIIDAALFAATSTAEADSAATVEATATDEMAATVEAAPTAETAATAEATSKP